MKLYSIFQLCQQLSQKFELLLTPGHWRSVKLNAAAVQPLVLDCVDTFQSGC